MIAFDFSDKLDEYRILQKWEQKSAWILFDIFYTFPIRILQSAVEFWNNSSRKQMASANEYFGPTMYRWGYHQRSKGIQARLKKNSFIQEFVPNYTLDAILAPRFTRDPQNIVARPPTFNNKFRIYEFVSRKLSCILLKELQSVFF